MQFITKRNSATGKKFLEIEKQKSACHKAQADIAKELGFTKWRHGYWTVWGGFSSVIFDDKTKVDNKVWKNVDGKKDERMPRLNTKEGKIIANKLKSAPVVSIDSLNKCIGFDGAPFNTIGFAHQSKIYFEFSFNEL